MKRIFTILSLIILPFVLSAQIPEQISYQAIVRDNSNQLVVNTTIGMRISILHNSESGSAVFIETQNPTTNANGLVSIKIGNGTNVSGDISTIDWSDGTYYIKTQIDLAGGTNYNISATTQILSVPYALFANVADSVSGGFNETDPVFIT